MLIISHRGYWRADQEKNSVEAFERSFSLGFGTETDIRDCAGELVISHDMPTGNELKFEEFLRLYSLYDKSLPLALNIKSDGLQEKIKSLLDFYSVTEYFTFDMTIPDMLGYLKKGIKVYARSSEYEVRNALWSEAQGIWLDGFSKLEIDVEELSTLIGLGKEVCIVSPELHRREVVEEWALIKSLPQSILASDKLILCTDIPEDAVEYFSND